MFNFVKNLISEDELKKLLPLSTELKAIKAERDQAIKNIICGKDKRKALIIGPCSADNEDAVCDYVLRLAKVADKVKDKIYIIPRIYTNKPRTRGEGYKGMLHTPDPTKGTDIQAGMTAIRHMHIRILKESGMTGAEEMLYPDNSSYLDDILNYVSVGARSCENQQHRLVASGIVVPVGIKNPTYGNLGVLINSIYAAQLPNEFKYNTIQCYTEGNDFAHAILRGGVDVYGNSQPNYHYEDIMQYLQMAQTAKLKNPAIIIDANHANSGKNPFEQPRIIHEVIYNISHDTQIANVVKGFMVESYIEDGTQSVNGGVYGKSITDACIGWDKTEKMIYEMAEKL